MLRKCIENGGFRGDVVVTEENKGRFSKKPPLLKKYIILRVHIQFRIQFFVLLRKVHSQ